MNEIERRPATVLRTSLAVSGLALIIWALWDDKLIGGGPGFGFFQAGVLVVGLVSFGSAFVPTRIGAVVLTSIVSLFFGLVLSEIALTLLLSPRLVSAYELDPDFLYKLKPGARSEYQHLSANGGSRHIYQINNDGFRGEAFRVPAGIPRIAVYGDSFIHAEFSTLENTYSKKLETALKRADFPQVEVINAGVAGFGPDQILLKLKKDLPNLQLDLLIVSIFSGNDFGDLARNKLFRLNSSLTLVENDFVLDPTIKLQAELAEHELLIRKALRNARDLFFGAPEAAATRKDRIAGALQQQLDEYENFVVDGNNVVYELRSDPYSADIAMMPESKSAKYKIAKMEATLAEIKNESETHGLPVMFVLIPHPIDVMRGDHASGQIDTDSYPQYSPNRLLDELTKICLRQQLNCLNLMDEFRNEGGESLFLKGGDDHWNNRGQFVGANATANFILGEKLLSHTGSGVDLSAR